MIKFCDRLQAFDSCLALFVFFPSMLCYWRGIWDLYGVYIYPGDAPKCHWVTAGIGACAIVGYYALPLLSHLLTFIRPPSKPAYVIITRIYMYFYGVMSMAYWRGVWGLADYYLLQFGWKTGLIGLIVGHGILLLLRSDRTMIFSPFVVAMDTRKDFLVPSTCFQTKVNWTQPRSVIKYTLDSLLTQYVVITTTILTWRSALTLVGHFVFPDDFLLASVFCAVTGFSAATLFFALETPINQLANHIKRTRHSYWLNLVFDDFIYFVVLFAETFLWYGAWNLNSRYIIADPKVGGWVNHGIGTVLLLSFQLISYTSACGCGRDGPADGDAATERDSFYDTKYLREIDQYLRERKESKRREEVASAEEREKCKVKEDDDDDDVADVVNGKAMLKGARESLLSESEIPLELVDDQSSPDSVAVVPRSNNVNGGPTNIL